MLTNGDILTYDRYDASFFLPDIHTFSEKVGKFGLHIL